MANRHTALAAQLVRAILLVVVVDLIAALGAVVNAAAAVAAAALEIESEVKSCTF